MPKGAGHGGDSMLVERSSPRFRLLASFVRDLREYAGRSAFKAGILVLLGAIVEGFGLLLLIPLLSVMLGTGAGGGATGDLTGRALDLLPSDSTPVRLLFLLSIFAGLMVIRALVLLNRDMLLARLQIGFVESQRLRVIRLLADTRWDRVVRLKHSRVTHILGSDVFNLRSAVHFVVQSCVASIMLAAQVGLLFLLSPLLAVAVLTLLVVGALALRPVLRRSRDSGAAVTEANLGLLTATGQFLSGLKHAMSQNLHQSFVRQFDALIAHSTGQEIAFARQRAIAGITLAAVASGLAGAAILVGIAILETPAPTLLASLIILGRLNGPATQLQQGAQHIFHSLPAHAKIKELEQELSAAPQLHRSMELPASERVRGDIEFRNVTMKHSAESEGGGGGVIDLNLMIRDSDFLGIRGPSGAGKTTFADMLVGLYPPSSGDIFVAGQQLRSATLSRWRNSVSYVSQDPFMFHDTIRNNLLWAAPDAGEDEMWEALAVAGAVELVRRTPDGLATVVGESGTLVSGGERQRIAIARALLRKPSLLVLDEATNAIDIHGEAALLERLTKLLPRPTIVMIAHRHSSLRHCTRIVDFEAGQVRA